MDSGEYTSLYYIGQDEIGLNVSNRVSHLRIFMHIDERDMSPSQTFCHIIEYTPYMQAFLKLKWFSDRNL